MGDGQIGEEPGGAGVENGEVFSARLVAERAGEPTPAQAARTGHEQIAALGDTVADGELRKRARSSLRGRANPTMLVNGERHSYHM
jgi:hypothetical protein